MVINTFVLLLILEAGRGRLWTHLTCKTHRQVTRLELVLAVSRCSGSQNSAAEIAPKRSFSMETLPCTIVTGIGGVCGLEANGMFWSDFVFNLAIRWLPQLRAKAMARQHKRSRALLWKFDIELVCALTKIAGYAGGFYDHLSAGSVKHDDDKRKPSVTQLLPVELMAGCVTVCRPVGLVANRKIEKCGHHPQENLY